MKRLFVALATATLIAGAAGAGVVYEIEVTDHEQSPPKSESIEAAIEGKNLKMGIASGGSGKPGTMIFRGDRREMVVVDDADRSYTVIDEAALQQLAGMMRGVTEQMKEALKNVPEDQRALVEKMMKERMPQQAPKRVTSELRKTGERGERNGYPCAKYEVYRSGTKIRELWVTDWDNVEGGSEMAGAFEGLTAFMEDLLDAMPDFPQGGAGSDPVFEHMKELGGFPVVTREFEDGSLESESKLKSSRRRTLDPAEFEPPAGYKRRSMMGGQ